MTDIDLQKHGLIEASAGTGKTYTIENLVVRILREEDRLELENILVVTFTEKAASELKIRIREKLEKELADPELDPKMRRKLRTSLDEFDKAAIHTIHGFCQTVLRDFAFENSAPLQSEVIQDAPMYERLLKEQMRRQWPKNYGKSLKDVLGLTGFAEKPGDFLNTILRLAKSFHESAGDRLLPDLGDRDFDRIQRELLAACMHVKPMVKEGFAKRYGDLDYHKTTKGNVCKKLVVPIEKTFLNLEGEKFDLGAFSRFMADVETVPAGGQTGFACLIPLKWSKGGPNLHVCPELEPVHEGLEEVRRLWADLRYCLMVAAVRQLQKDVALVKEEHGWISYYDMLARVENVLSGPGADDLLSRLRKRFKAAFIDEFQDTDPVQWRIFKTIFIVSPDEPGNRLFVIGDPKQAIYAFRGADVYAYLGARSEMERLEQEEKAGRYALSINWRSEPRLIRIFNHLFCRDAWFKPEDAAGVFDIGYQESGAPPSEMRLAQIVSDTSERAALNIVDLCESPSPKPAKLRYARFVAREIRHLVNADIRIQERGGRERVLDFGDMAILVRTRSDVPFLEEALIRENIPYAYYKKPGLFESDEAVYTRLVFHAILDPGDGSAVKKALLTPFFGWGLQDLYACDDMPPTHPVKELLFKWNGLALTRRWGFLFQSLMEDSGLLARKGGGSRWDREYANYRQIFEFLEEAAYRKNLDFRRVCALLESLQSTTADMEEGVDIHQIETETQKVQIMTLHVSKGLQYPVVFLAGGLTQPGSNREAYHTYHRFPDSSGGDGSCDDAATTITRIFDLHQSDREQYETEKQDEDKRLYYVGATRAQFKLYLPFYQYKKRAAWLGPVCTLVSPALMEAFPSNEDNSDVCWLRPEALPVVRTTTAPDVPTDAVKGALAVTGFKDILIPESYADRRIRVDSFSSLHQDKQPAENMGGGEVRFQPEELAKEDDEPLSGIHSALLGTFAFDDMPGGIDVGLMFHGILEQLDYSSVAKFPPDVCPEKGLLDDIHAREIILGQMKTYGVALQWRDAVCKIIWNTLKTPIPPFEDEFTLGRLKSTDRLHEAEFYYVVADSNKGSAAMPTGDRPRRFIRGFVDLIFRKDGRYYVADWKSNVLEAGYDQDAMAESMAASGYHLQYKLYAIAALRWLKQTLGERFDPERDWGGIFYFYLRGMGTGRGHGVYHVPPDQLGTLDQLEEQMERHLA